MATAEQSRMAVPAKEKTPPAFRVRAELVTSVCVTMPAAEMEMLLTILKETGSYANEMAHREFAGQFVEEVRTIL